MRVGMAVFVAVGRSVVVGVDDRVGENVAVGGRGTVAVFCAITCGVTGSGFCSQATTKIINAKIKRENIALGFMGMPR